MMAFGQGVGVGVGIVSYGWFVFAFYDVLRTVGHEDRLLAIILAVVWPMGVMVRTARALADWVVCRSVVR